MNRDFIGFEIASQKFSLPTRLDKGLCDPDSIGPKVVSCENCKCECKVSFATTTPCCGVGVIVIS